MVIIRIYVQLMIGLLFIVGVKTEFDILRLLLFTLGYYLMDRYADMKNKDYEDKDWNRCARV